MSERKHIEHGMDNVFGIEECEKCTCSILYYRWDHPFMRISLQGGKDTAAYLDFLSVLHFEGPPAWSGANFQVTSKEERDNFIQKIGYAIDDIYTKNTFLYQVEIKHPTIQGLQLKILARQAYYFPFTGNYSYSYEDDLLERITIFPKSGEPVIQKTEIHEIHGIRKEMGYMTPVRSILALFERGYTVQDILAFERGYTVQDILALDFWLEPEDIQAALVYARRAIGKPSNTE